MWVHFFLFTCLQSYGHSQHFSVKDSPYGNLNLVRYRASLYIFGGTLRFFGFKSCYASCSYYDKELV